MVKETGCIAKCSYTQYSFEKVDDIENSKSYHTVSLDVVSPHETR